MDARFYSLEFCVILACILPDDPLIVVGTGEELGIIMDNIAQDDNL
jgi:hypothetical protein